MRAMINIQACFGTFQRTFPLELLQNSLLFQYQDSSESYYLQLPAAIPWSDSLLWTQTDKICELSAKDFNNWLIFREYLCYTNIDLLFYHKLSWIFRHILNCRRRFDAMIKLMHRFFPTSRQQIIVKTTFYDKVAEQQWHQSAQLLLQHGFRPRKSVDVSTSTINLVSPLKST